MRSCLLLVLLCGLWAQAQGMTVFVAPHGNDAHQGTQRNVNELGQGPVATVGRALALIRASRQLRAAPEADHVVLLPGRYSLKQAVVLTPDDSGQADAPLHIRAEEPGSVVLSGAVDMKGFQAVPGAPYWRLLWREDKGFHVLWVNGRRAVRARSPNQGLFYSGASNVVPAVAGDRLQRPRNAYNVINTQKLILPEPAGRVLSASRKPEQQAVLVAVHSWTSSAHRIVHWDAERGAATVQPESLWSFLRFGPDQRFALENLPEFLDEPGEWWLSPEGELRYWPRPSESVAHAVAHIPQLERLLVIEGNARRPVQHVHISGLTFAHSAAWTTPFIDSQAATAAPTSVVLTHAHRVVLEGCRFEQLGGHGVWLRKGSRHVTLQRNVFSGLGAGAVRIGEMSMPADEPDFVHGNAVLDNLIEDVGGLFPGAVAIWVGQSGQNRVAHNEIKRTSYTGISVGWTWGFGGSRARDNVIEYNLLSDIGSGVLSDLGGVYTLGISPGTVIRHNLIKNVRSFKKQGATAWGIYLDEGSSDILVENNWVEGSTGGGLHLHYGNRNVVQNNVFRDGDAAQVRRTRRHDSALTMRNNLLWQAQSGVLWDKEWADDEVQTSQNIIVGITTPPIGQALAAFQRQGKEAGSVSVPASQIRCAAPSSCKLSEKLIQGSEFKPLTLDKVGIRRH